MENKRSFEELMQEYAPNVKLNHVIIGEKTKIDEGTGRASGSGGKACNYCSHCYGNSDWCPYLD